MSSSALFTLILTVGTAALLISEWIRPDLIALLVMVIMGLGNILPPEETFAGFSSSVVMTLMGIFIISEGLHQAGITRRLGVFMHHLGQNSEWRLMLIVTLTSAGLSLFMNNIAVIGVLLPATIFLSHQTQIAPSRLLLPLAYGTILGGMATLLTTANIVVSGSLQDAGFQPFGLLDFLPIGIPIIVFGTLYMITIGRRLFPSHSPMGRSNRIQQLHQELINQYKLKDNLYELEVLPKCPLANKSIADSMCAQKIGINIVGIVRKNRTYLKPNRDDVVLVGDHLFVYGELMNKRLQKYHLRTIKNTSNQIDVSDESITLSELIITPRSSYIGKRLQEIHFREKFNINILAIWREGHPIYTGLRNLRLKFGDALLVHGSASDIHRIHNNSNLALLEEDSDAVMKPGKQYLALLITLLTLGVASTNILPIAEVILAGAVYLC